MEYLKISFFYIFSRFLYPGIVALIVSSISYPLGTGRFIAGELSTHEQVHELFTNFTWTAAELTVEQATIVNHWSTEYTDVFFHLTAYMLFTVNIPKYTHVICLTLTFKNKIANQKYLVFSVRFFDYWFNYTSSQWNVHSCIQNWRIDWSNCWRSFTFIFSIRHSIWWPYLTNYPR